MIIEIYLDLFFKFGLHTVKKNIFNTIFLSSTLEGNLFISTIDWRIKYVIEKSRDNVIKESSGIFLYLCLSINKEKKRLNRLFNLI